MDYETAVRETWRHSDLSRRGELYRELVRYATLAASSHNTQPWKFKLAAGAISILPDLSRRCPQVDPDDHHLFVSLGCAAENLLIAARAAGLGGTTHAEREFRIEFEPTAAERSVLFEAIPQRQCSRSEYDGTKLGVAELKVLEEAASGKGVAVLLLTDRGKLDVVADFVAQGNRSQIGDGAWVRELKAWIRFNEREALRTRDGLYSKAVGNPDVPRLIGDMFMRFAFTAASQTKTDVRNIRSSAGIAVFTSEANDKHSWFEVGRCYERFALQATALGIRNAFVNHLVEVAGVRPQFASWVGIGGRRPDLVVRFGHGAEMPRSLRRPVEEVLAPASSTVR